MNDLKFQMKNKKQKTQLKHQPCAYTQWATTEFNIYIQIPMQERKQNKICKGKKKQPMH